MDSPLIAHTAPLNPSLCRYRETRMLQPYSSHHTITRTLCMEQVGIRDGMGVQTSHGTCMRPALGNN